MQFCRHTYTSLFACIVLAIAVLMTPIIPTVSFNQDQLYLATTFYTHAQPIDPNQNEETVGDCAWNEIVCQLKAGASGLFKHLVAIGITAVFSFLGMLLALIGWFLNASIEFSILNMSNHITGSGIEASWTILRDLVNIGFIFIIIYIAIQYILNADNAQTSKLLRNLVLIALLINFSLLGAKLVVDTSNILTIGLYNQMRTTEQSDAVQTGEQRSVQGIAAAFMQPLGVTSLWRPDQTISVLASNSWGKLLAIGLMGPIFIIITGFVLLGIATSLLVRLIIIIFLLILSPLAIASFALPYTQKHGFAWISRLIQESFFAPVLFALLLAVLSILQSSNFLAVDGDGLMGSVTGGSPGAIDNIIKFLIISGMMIAVLIVARKISTFSGSAARWTSGRAASMSVGVGAAKADQALSNTRFGNTRTGMMLRNITTNPLQNNAFGGGKSGKQIKETEEKRKQNLKNIRTKHPAEVRDKMTEKVDEKTDAAKVRSGRKIEKLEGDYQKAEKRKQDARQKQTTGRNRYERQMARMQEQEENERQQKILETTEKEERRVKEQDEKRDRVREKANKKAQAIIEKQRQKMGSRNWRRHKGAREEYEAAKKNVNKSIDDYRREKQTKDSSIKKIKDIINKDAEGGGDKKEGGKKKDSEDKS